MSDVERQLRRTLDERAAQVESDLTGPELRRLAADRRRTDHRLRRAVPVLASAAAVAALGISAALLTRPQDDPRPVQPGGPGPVSTAPSPATSSPRSVSPSQRPATPSSPPVRSATPRVSKVPTGRISVPSVEAPRSTVR